MQSNGRRAQRLFGTVSEILDDGGAMIRRLDGGPDVRMDAQHARRVGEELREGVRLEFELRYVNSAAGQVAVEGELLEGRVLPALAR